MKLIRSQWAGLYKKNENYLYVNRGLGTIGFPARIDMNPEITLLTLKRGKIY
jgi:predicted MPP superfamily phosphohydrolase